MAHQNSSTPGTDDALQEALRPGHPAYPEAATTLLGAGTPDLIVRPSSAADVAAAVDHARSHALELTVRSGGHSIAGLSRAEAGVLLDLRAMDRIQVDPVTRLVRIGGGASWGQVAEALRSHGLGLTAGDTAGVGVGGLTLGGGIGWMVRRHGLAIDSLVGAQVVTPDGQVREVGPGQDPELFWALRGGGAGLGVVTRFDFVAQQVSDVVFGRLVLALDDVPRLLAGWRDVQLGADDRLTTTLSLMPALGGEPAVAVVALCFAGSQDDAASLLARLRGLGPVLSDDVAVRPYAEILEDEEPPAGMRLSMRNALLPELDEEVLADITDLVTPPTMVTLRALGGAFSRVPTEATAFPDRSAQALVVAVRFSTDPDDPALAQIPGWERVARHGTGAYGNFESEVAPSWSDTTPTGHRLARVRADLDPTGLLGPSNGPRQEVAS